MCALVYQVAWFRELRLIFGVSTASSAAVLAVFMGGLGIGGARLGKIADRSANPLGLYANLELGVAATAAATPILVALASSVYLGAGGSTALGLPIATLLRLVLATVVLAPSTLLMGGTLPAAARAVERAGDAARRSVATLYAVNTLGAVAGAVAANFVLLEVLGTRLTLWMAALVNVLVALLARSLSRSQPGIDPPSGATGADEPAAEPGPPAVAEQVPWFPKAASALAGVTFMLMELTWYRMLAPILGGSSYTFGLILAVALVGIGIGGAIYARGRIEATLKAFAFTCALEAVFVAIPFALGDRIALTTATLRSAARLGFGPSVLVWTLVTAFVVLPAAIVAGAQFPLVIGLYGKGRANVGKDVGAAYLANTLGAIGGSLAGGFGILPLLGAVGCWRLSVFALVAGASVALYLDAKLGGRRDASYVRGVVLTGLGLLLMAAQGPTAVWRHSGIGAGRADVAFERGDLQTVLTFEHFYGRHVKWEEDGLESSVALGQGTGYAFIVNGKSDGHSIDDAPTQVMSGLVPAILHPGPKKTLVVGLGTGSTAGWLAAIPSMERVDVVELEPAIVKVARDCAPVNKNVLDNPKVHVQLADAREVLRTTKSRYDIIFSEPSNPYRAGISSLYTTEYYRSSAERLEEGGLFVQWMQAYEVDGWAIATAIVTLKQVFEDVEVWTTKAGDLLVVASRTKRAPVDVARVRATIASEPFATAMRSVWYTDSVEGLFSHFIATSALSDALAANGLGAVNTDDQNFLEFAFARSVGKQRRGVDSDLRDLSRRLGTDEPRTTDPLDKARTLEERWLWQALTRIPFDPPLAAYKEAPLRRVLDGFAKGDHAGALRPWLKLARPPRHLGEAMMVAELAARAGGMKELPLVELAPPGPEREVVRAIAWNRGGDSKTAAQALAASFVRLRTDPWIRPDLLGSGLWLASDIGAANPVLARGLHAAVDEPFAVDQDRDTRLEVRARLASAMGDPVTCARAVEALEPPVVTKAFLDLRASCYRAASHPLAERAAADLADLLGRTEALGANLGASKSSSAPSSAPSASAPPTLDPEDDPKDGGAGSD